MKVEKIEKNKIKIILTFDELHEYGITLNDIKHGSQKAQAFFMALIEDANLDTSFILGTPDLFIEASTSSSKLFMITITKLDNVNSNTSNIKNNYYINSNVFVFNDFDILKEFANLSLDLDTYFGVNNLYKLKNKFIIVFTKSTIRNTKFIPSFSFVTEYCSSYFSKPNIENYLNEHGTLLIDKKAIQKLSEFSKNNNQIFE